MRPVVPGPGMEEYQEWAGRLVDYEPCQGADEPSAVHAFYCVPFYEWRIATLEDMGSVARMGGED